MPIETVHRYTRDDIQANPTKLYVFGDNMARVGYGGQAGEARDEPNAVGIPTLWSPGTYFSDNCPSKARILARIDAAIGELNSHLRTGGTVVLPADGIGTGISRLPEMAPNIYRYITASLKTLDDWKADK